MDYEMGLLGMKLDDASSLAAFLPFSTNLVSLVLSQNGIDDDILTILLEGLSQVSILFFCIFFALFLFSCFTSVYLE